MKVISLLFLIINSFSLHSQKPDTIHVIDYGIWVNYGSQLIKPITLPISTDIVSYSYYKFPKDSNSIVVKGVFLNKDEVTFSLYKRSFEISEDAISYVEWNCCVVEFTMTKKEFQYKRSTIKFNEISFDKLEKVIVIHDSEPKKK
jgi:hypothetical protein